MWKTSWGHPGCRGKWIQFFDGSLGLLLVAWGWMKSNWWWQRSVSLLLLGAGEDGDKDRNLNGGGNVNVGADLDAQLRYYLVHYLLRNNSARDPKPLEEGQLEEEPFGDDQVWAAVLAQEEQHHAEVMRQRAEYHGMSPSTNSHDEEEVEQMLQDTQARMERLSLEPDGRHLPVRKTAKQPHRQGEPSTVHHGVKSTQYGHGTVTLLDEGCVRGLLEGGMETNVPKLELVELGGLIKATWLQALVVGEKMEGDDNEREEAGGVAGAKRVVKRSSTSSFTRRGEIAVGYPSNDSNPPANAGNPSALYLYAWVPIPGKTRTLSHSYGPQSAWFSSHVVGGWDTDTVSVVVEESAEVDSCAYIGYLDST
ncbi:hypothetical protein BJY52DRAFT_1227615 [Lactarius psammicola]|nr:hypothetical protein BJY52DRAFT_1227615 [Lactarius psammicola]